jgi:hypothetical protein
MASANTISLFPIRREEWKGDLVVSPSTLSLTLICHRVSRQVDLSTLSLKEAVCRNTYNSTSVTATNRMHTMTLYTVQTQHYVPGRQVPRPTQPRLSLLSGQHRARNTYQHADKAGDSAARRNTYQADTQCSTTHLHEQNGARESTLTQHGCAAARLYAGHAVVVHSLNSSNKERRRHLTPGPY